MKTKTKISGDKINTLWEWETHIDGTDGILTKGDDALNLIKSLDEDEEVIVIEFPDNPELSKAFNLSGLTAAIEGNNLVCLR